MPPLVSWRGTAISYDSTHRIGINRVCPGYSNYSFAIGHSRMFTLPCDPKTCFLKGLYGTFVIYTWQTGQFLSDFYVTRFFTLI